MNLRISKTGSSSCQCTMTLYGKQKETKSNVNTIHRIMPANCLAVIGLSWGLDQKKSGTEPTLTNQMGSWDRMAEEMVANFSRSGHPIFRASSALERRELRSKRGCKKSIQHFNCSDKKHRVASPHSDFCESAQHLRSNNMFMQRSTQRF